VTDLDELIALAPPPPQPPPVDWDAAPELPDDYRALVDRYGAGSFAGMGLLVPGHPNRFLNLEWQVDRQRDAMRTIETPYPPDELLPWGIDENGNVAWWVMRDDWPVVANEARGHGWLRHEGGVVSFLAGVLARRIDPDFLAMRGDVPFEPFAYAPAD
jgi:hypothetical protein